MTKNKKLLMWSIFFIAIFQMPNMAISPCINRLYTEIFSDKPLATIQTTIALTSIMGPPLSLGSAFLIRQGKLSKRAVVLTGLVFLSLSGVLSLFIHDQFWQFALLAILVGLGAGCYISTTISVMMDNFEGAERQLVAGRQQMFVTGGAVVLGIVGGLLVDVMWYGGYTLMCLGIPTLIFAFFALPHDGRTEKGSDKPKTKSRFNPDVLYYFGMQFLLFILFAVCSNNISVHLAASGAKNPSLTAGFASAILMGGSFFAALFFKKLSARLGDMLIALAFLLMAFGYTIINICSFSIPLIFVGVFFLGTAFSFVTPQCTVSASKRVDESTSTLSTALLNSLAPGVGSLLSPIIITNITTALAGNNTGYRYQFTAFLALAVSILCALCNRYRAKKQAGLYD